MKQRTIIKETHTIGFEPPSPKAAIIEAVVYLLIIVGVVIVVLSTP